MRNLSTQLEKIFSFFVFGICCLWLFAVDASALTYSVTSTTDAGAGSLRQAVADANATTANDTINFNIAPTDPNCNASGVCTITLTGGVIVVQASSGTLTIANQTGASRLLISGNNLNRIFEVSQNANLTIDGVTVTRGLSNSSSGVISNMRGTLTVMNSIFTQMGHAR